MAIRIKDSRFLKVWKIEDSEYGKRFTLGSSRKYQDKYYNSNWFGVKFVGGASAFGDTLKEGDKIDIVSGQIENIYNAEKKTSYLNLTVFEAKMSEDTYGATAPKKPNEKEEDYPF